LKRLILSKKIHKTGMMGQTNTQVVYRKENSICHLQSQ